MPAGVATIVRSLRVVAVAGALGFSGCFASGDQNSDRSTTNALIEQLTRSSGRVMVVAHRACWRFAPENSVRAIEECVRIGVDMIEIDVQRTRDGHLVIIHDDTVDRTTNGSGKIANLTLAEVASLRLKAGDGGADTALTDQRVPTLEQALTSAKDRILVNLDVKGSVRDESYAVAESLGVADQVLIKMSLTSPYEEKLDEMKFFGNTHFMPIIREEKGNLIEQVRNFDPINPVAFEVIYKKESELAGACAAAEGDGARCWVNTMWDRLSPGHSDEVSVANPDDHWGHLVRLGVDMIQTDQPSALLQYLSDAGVRQQ